MNFVAIIKSHKTYHHHIMYGDNREKLIQAMIIEVDKMNGEKRSKKTQLIGNFYGPQHFDLFGKYVFGMIQEIEPYQLNKIEGFYHSHKDTQENSNTNSIENDDNEQ